MHDLEAPPIPHLSEARLIARQQHLVQEIAARRRRRQRRGFALGGAGLLASGVTAGLVVLVGAGTPSAFAAWTSSPTAPSPGQVAAAEGACGIGAENPPPTATPLPTNVTLTTTRGPFTLVLFGTNTTTRGPVMCMSGPDGTQSTANAVVFSAEGGSQPATPSPDQIALDRFGGAYANGQRYTIAEGSAGSAVSAATLVLSDGTRVVATTGNGLFLAWWPGSATVRSATVTTATGTTTQAINYPAGTVGSAPVGTGGSGTNSAVQTRVATAAPERSGATAQQGAT